jgi:hypothetical protein
MRAYDKYITSCSTRNYIHSMTEQQRSREYNHSSSGAEIRNGWSILPLTHPLKHNVAYQYAEFCATTMKQRQLSWPVLRQACRDLRLSYWM